MMVLRQVYSRLRMVTIVKGVVTLVAMLVAIILLNTQTNTLAGESGDDLSGLIIVSIVPTIVSYVALIYMLFMLLKWRRLVAESDRDSVLLLMISAIIGIVAPIVGAVNIYYSFMFLYPIVVYILDTIAYSHLKDSSTMSENERRGFAKLFKSQMVLLIGFAIVAFLWIMIAVKAISGVFGDEPADESELFARKVLTTDILINAFMVCVFVISVIYFYFQIRGWNILAKAQPEEKALVEE